MADLGDRLAGDRLRAAVVGHVEWIEFARVDRLPASGEIAHSTATWEEVGGGGAVSAVQLAKLAGECLFLTVLGDDDLGRRCQDELTGMGVDVRAAFRGRQRRALTHVEPSGERTITTLGEKLSPSAADALPWDELARCDAVYFVTGDAEALRAARAARVVVATMRDLGRVLDARVELDAVIGSGRDRAERYPAEGIVPAPGLVVTTEGSAGGSWAAADGRSGRWEPAPLPGPVGDAYGAGDSFAACLTYGVGQGMAPAGAIELAARCGAACTTGHGPYAGQISDPPRSHRRGRSVAPDRPTR